MNSREINQLAIKLNSIVNSLGEGGLTQLTRDVESAISESEMLDEKDKQDLQQSFNPKTQHYQINITDKELVKNAKAALNLLRSLDSALPTVILPTVERLVNSVMTGSNVKTAATALMAGVGMGISHYATKAGGALLGALPAAFTGAVTGATPNLPPTPAAFAGAATSGKVSVTMQETSPTAFSGVAAGVIPGTDIERLMQVSEDVQAFMLHANQLGSFVPQLTGLQEESRQMLSSLQGVLENRNLMDCATYISQISSNEALGGTSQIKKHRIGKSPSDTLPDTGVSKTLSAAKAYVFEHISDHDKDKFYDVKNDRFEMPDEKKKENADNINAMIAYNVSDRARKSINTINHFLATWDRTNSLPTSQFPAMIELINKLGKVVSDLNRLNTEELQEVLRSDLYQGIQELLKNVGPILPQLAAIAQETELRAGLKDNSILSKLGSVCKQYEDIASKYEVTPSAEYPYTTQKAAVIDRLATEGHRRIADLVSKTNQFIDYDSGLKKLIELNTPKLVNVSAFGSADYDYQTVLPTLEQLKNIRDYASGINTAAGSALLSTVNWQIKKLTGINTLMSDIAKAEKKVADLVAYDEADKKRENYVPFDEDDAMELALEDVKKLYAIRDEMLSSNKDQHYQTNKDGVGDLLPGLIEPRGSMENGLRKLQTEMSAANADIDSLVTVEENKMQRLQALMPPDKNNQKRSIDPPEITDRKREALRTMRGGKMGNNRTEESVKMAAFRVQNLRQAAASAANAPDTSNGASTRPQAPDENAALIAAIVERRNGPVIESCNKAKKFLIDGFSNYLSPEQCNLLNVREQKNGLYTLSDTDGLLVANIKNTYNALTRVTELMQNINRISDFINNSEYTKIVPMIPVIMKDMENIINELSTTNQSFNQLREFLVNVGDENIPGLEQIYSSINSHLPAGMNGMVTDCFYALSMFTSQDAKEKLSTLKELSANFCQTIDAFARNTNPNTGRRASAEAAGISVNTSIAMGKQSISMNTETILIRDGFNAMLQKLESQSPKSIEKFKRKDGTYRLKKMTAGSSEHKFAACINAIIGARDALASSEKIAKKRSFKSTINLVSQVLKVIEAYQQFGPHEHIKSMLESMEPEIMRAYALITLTEKTLGTSNLLTAHLDPQLQKFFDLAKYFQADLKGEYPYAEVQGEIAYEHLEYLYEQKNQRDQVLNHSKEKLSAMTQFIDTQTPKLESVSSFGGADYSDVIAALPSLAQINALKSAATEIQSFAGVKLANMTDNLIKALKGINELDKDIASQKNTVAALKAEMEQLKEKSDTPNKTKQEELEHKIETAEKNITTLEGFREKLLSSNNEQHYTSKPPKIGEMEDGLITLPEQKIKSLLSNLQSAVNSATADINSQLNAAEKHCSHMQALFGAMPEPNPEIRQQVRQ